jgi:hypothetical protein
MLYFMDTNKTAIERAFDLARSGRCVSVGALVKRLDREGYWGGQIEGPQLKKLLTQLIEEATHTYAHRP